MRTVLSRSTMAWLTALPLGFSAASGFAKSAKNMVGPPTTPRRPVVTEYHGVSVTDDYRWLEDASDTEVVDWTRQQNAFSRQRLDAFPDRPAIERRLEALYSTAGAKYIEIKSAGGQVFATKSQPPKEQPTLVRLQSPDDPASERVLVDPVAIDSTGTTSIQSFFPSANGELIAVVLAKGGSEQGSLHLYETASGKALGDVIERVAFPTGGGSLAWDADSKGFFYTRYPRPGERPEADLPFYEQVFHHRIGTSDSVDQFVAGWEFPRIAEVFLSTSPDGRYLLVTVQNGDGGSFAHWLRGPDQSIRRIADFGEDLKPGVFGPDDALYFLSKKNAPKGKIVRMPLKDPLVTSIRDVVPEGAAAIDGYSWRELEILPNFVVASDRILLPEVAGGPSQVRVFDLQGHLRHAIDLPPVCAVDHITRLAEDQVLYRVGTFLQPHAWHRLRLDETVGRRTAFSEPAPSGAEAFEVVRELATSKDGTKVPLSIIRHRGIRLNGEHPTLLTGYGGYGVNIVPKEVGAKVRVWLEQGGVYVVANLRGGGEFGDDWHKAGNLTKKHNVFDDFLACAQHLVNRKYTRASRLAIEGGSNGGLLMGAALTQKPKAFRAVISHVGLYDMLRAELDANGAFNVPEFGTVTDLVQFQALRAYSPYHSVTNGVRYPGVLFLTGENDGRVNPSHSRKMTAALQQANASEAPILLRTSATSGHGHGTAYSERMAQDTDVLAFLFDQLGLRFKETARGSSSSTKP
ncbi:MAG: S9 family peptidase [Verrucomicrobiales bacterium]|nr:S9 family peptidase [Verrucomicrobiales bacterium]